MSYSIIPDFSEVPLKQHYPSMEASTPTPEAEYDYKTCFNDGFDAWAKVLDGTGSSFAPFNARRPVISPVVDCVNRSTLIFLIMGPASSLLTTFIIVTPI